MKKNKKEEEKTKKEGIFPENNIINYYYIYGLLPG